MIEKKIGQMNFIAGVWPLLPDRPTLVFISGAGANGIFWQAQVEALSDVANTIAVDLPGHGGSDGKGAFTLGEYAQAVEKLILDLNAPMPVLCGVSMGGGIVLELLIRKGVPFSAGIVINSAARLKFFPKILKILRQKHKGKIDYHRLFSELAVSKKSDPEKMQRLIDASSTFDPQVSICDICACNIFDATGKLHQITVPVLIITTSDDVIVSPSNGEYLKENIPCAQLVHITDVGHLAPIEKPEEINATLCLFLHDQGFLH